MFRFKPPLPMQFFGKINCSIPNYRKCYGSPILCYSEKECEIVSVQKRLFILLNYKLFAQPNQTLHNFFLHFEQTVFHYFNFSVFWRLSCSKRPRPISTWSVSCSSR